MSQFEGREICRLIKTAGPCFLLGCVAREDFVVSTWIGLGSVTSYRNRFGVITARPALSEVIYTPLDDCCLVPTYLKGLWNFASWLFFLSFLSLLACSTFGTSERHFHPTVWGVFQRMAMDYLLYPPCWMGQQLVYYICAVSVPFASTLLGPSHRGFLPLSYALRTFSPRSRSWPAGDFFLTAETAKKKMPLDHRCIIPLPHPRPTVAEELESWTASSRLSSRRGPKYLLPFWA